MRSMVEGAGRATQPSWMPTPPSTTASRRSPSPRSGEDLLCRLRSFDPAAAEYPVAGIEDSRLPRRDAIFGGVEH